MRVLQTIVERLKLGGLLGYDGGVGVIDATVMKQLTEYSYSGQRELTIQYQLGR